MAKADLKNEGGAGGGKVVIRRQQKMMIYLGATAILLLVAAIFVSTYSQNTGCGNILVAQQKYSCLSSKALSSGNVSYCLAIGLPGARASCASALANKTLDISYCSTLNGSYYAECATGIAVRTANDTYCSGVAGAGRGNCYLSVANAQGYADEGTCANITNSTGRFGCYYSYFYEKATSSGNSSYCSMITGSQNSTYLSDIVGLSSNLTLAESGVLSYYNVTPRDYCYIELARETLNKSVCSQVSGGPAELCYASFEAINVTNSTSNFTSANITAECNAYPASVRSLCLTSGSIGEAIAKAIGSRNASYCSGISELGYRYDCYIDFAEQLNQSSACNYIANSTIRSYCYSSVANYST
ncbi:MAG: hypothetical protein QXN59_02545 [Candidatus Micrarchaeaceae archaeon]